MINLSMKKKLLLIFIVLFTIPIAVSLLMINYNSLKFSHHSNELLNMRSIKYVKHTVNEFFNSVYDFNLYLNAHDDILEFLDSPIEDIYDNNISVSAQNTISLIPFSNNNIMSIAISGNDDRYIQSGLSRLTFTQEEKNIAIANKGAPFWNVTDEGIYLVRLLRSADKLNVPLGYLKIELNINTLNNILTTEGDNALQYTIVSSDNLENYTLKTQADFSTPTITQEMITNSMQKSQYYSESNCYLTSIKLDSIDGYLYCLSNDSYSVSVFSTLMNALIISMIVCFAFCLILSVIFSSAIVAPLKKLGNLMGRIENEDFSVQFLPKGNDEIGQLAYKFDSMSQKLNVLYNQVYMDKLKLKEMQLEVLQSQINPHFLYNTLDTIYWMSEFNHTDDISKMISSLSHLFRLALSGTENDVVNINTELEHIECYLYIQKIRHNDDLIYTVTNDLESDDYPVLKLIMQPLVENAIIHGIEVVGKGTIHIHIFKQNNDLIYEISDSAGTADINNINQILNNSQTQSDDKQSHIGLLNIQTRIHLRYGNNYGLSCKLENEKTVFTVKMPILNSPTSEGDIV